MELKEATSIVLDLARDNIVDPRSCNEENIEQEQARQIEAISMLENFGVLHFIPPKTSPKLTAEDGAVFVRLARVGSAPDKAPLSYLIALRNELDQWFTDITLRIGEYSVSVPDYESNCDERSYGDPHLDPDEAMVSAEAALCTSEDLCRRHAQSCHKCFVKIIDDEGNPSYMSEACEVGARLLRAYNEAERRVFNLLDTKNGKE